MIMNNRQSAPGIRSAIGSVTEQIRAEQRWLTLMRLVISGTCLSWVLFFTGLPWAPIAKMVPGYDMSGSLRFVLLVGGIFGLIVYRVVWRPILRHESSAEFVRVLFGAGLLIRGRQQFKGRLSAECGRGGKDSRNVFSLIVLKLSEQSVDPMEPPSEREFEGSLAAIAVRSIARSGDVVADAAPNEVWVLAVGADDQGRENIVRRMASKLSDEATSLPLFVGARIGSATFPADGWRPNDLFATAYRAVAPLPDLREISSAA